MTWHEVSLKQICAVDWGNTKLTKSSYVANGKFLAVSAAGADGLIDHYEHEADVPVLSAIGAQCGRMFYPGERFTAIKNTITLTPKEDMADGKFLYYLFTHVVLPQRGAGQPFISKGDIEAFRVSIPQSLEEQRKIVEKLDSAFAEIEVAKLQTSYSIQNLSKLLDSKFEEVFIIMENEYGLVQSGTLIDVRDGTHDSPSYYDSGYPLITSKNLQDGLIDFAKVSFISKDDYDQINKRSKVETGDLLFAMIGTIGNPVVVKDAPSFAIKNVALFKANPKYSMIFFSYYLRTPKMKEKFQREAKGTTQRFLGLGYLRTFDIPNVPIEVQIDIVIKLEQIESEIKKMELNLKRRLENFIALNNSILSSSFTFDSEKEEVA